MPAAKVSGESSALSDFRFTLVDGLTVLDDLVSQYVSFHYATLTLCHHSWYLLCCLVPTVGTGNFKLKLRPALYLELSTCCMWHRKARK